MRHQRDSVDDEAEGGGLLASVRETLVRHPRDAVIAAIVTALIVTIFVNGLFLQPGPHPAPIFAVTPSPVASSDATGAILLPRRRPAEAWVTPPP
jgi:hypothetical protein